LAVDSATLVARYPEFTAAVSAQADMVIACIAQAEALVDRVRYGSTKADAAVHALAAHFVAISPLDGEIGRLDKRSDKTVYLLQYQQILRSLGLGAQVL
jgi:hypothetical protein